MVKLFSYFALLLILAFVITPAHAQSGFAPSSWPAPRHDMQLTGRATVLGPSKPILQWTIALGSGQLIAPAIAADGAIYVPGNVNDTLYAVSPAGRLLWTFTGKKLTPEEFVAPAVLGRDGVIYFGSTQNIFYAVNPNGTLRWSVKLDGPIRHAANIGEDGVIYVAARDSRLYAITPAGTIKWRVNLDRLPGNGPAISTDGTIYVVAGEWLQGFAPDGTRRLQVNCSDLGVLTGLVIDGFELIYVTGDAPRVRAISNSAATRWEYNFPASFGAPRLPALGKDRSLYLVSAAAGEIVVLNPDGSKRWSATPATKKFLTEVILDDANQLYVVDDNNGLMSASADGLLRWNLREVHCQFTPAIGPDGTIYISSNKKLYAISARAPKLVMDSAGLDWGQICAGTAATRQFAVSNAGNADLRVTNVSVSPVSFQVEPASFILPPNGRQIVTVKFVPEALVNYAGTLTIDSDAGNTTLPLKGAGVGAKIAAVQEILQFGDVVLGKEKTQTAQITAAVCEVRIDSVKVSGAYSVLTGSFPKFVAAGDTAEFIVRFQPAILGGQTATLLVYNNDPQRNPLMIALNGNSVSTRPEIDVTPLALEFGKVCNATPRYTIVANWGDQPLRVEALVFSSAAFATTHAKNFTVAPGKQDTIRIEFTPSAGVESSGTLTIFSNDADEKSVAVKLHGAGDFPNIAGLATIDFGVVDVQICAGLANTAERAYVIRNNGSCALKIDSLLAGGVFTLAAPFVPQEIPAGGSLNIVLQFTPNATGEQNRRLRIVSNDPGARVMVVNLRGRGAAAPDIAVAGDTINFGVVSVGRTEWLPFKIRNVGELNLAVTDFTVSSPRFTVTTRQLALSCKQDSIIAIAFSPDSMGAFTGTLSIGSNDPDEAAVKIFLRGAGAKSVQALISGAAEYRFPTLCLGSRDSLRAVITNNGNAPLRVDSLRVQNHRFDGSSPTRQIFSLPGAGFSLQPQQSKTLTVWFQPARRTEYATTVQVFSNASNSRVFTFGLRGAGSGAEISGPNTLAFALTKVDSARQEVYVLNNLGNCSLGVTRVYIEGDHANEFKIIDARATVIAPRGSLRLAVEFKPNVASARLAKLVILNTDLMQPRFEIALNGSGSGAPGKMSGTTALNFGEACFEENIARACSLTNSGDADLRIIRLFTARGELFKLPGGPVLPKVLRRQETVVIPVIFSPKQSGAFSDTLLMQTDLAVGSWWRVPLQGAGRQDMARLAFSHQAFAFNGHLDEPKTEVMTITNTGCARLEINQIELARKLRVFSVRPQAPLPVKLESMQSLKVQISFKGDDFRAFADSLYIYCVDWQQNRERLSVSLLGKVTEGAPCLQLATTRLDFGEVPVGQVKRLDLEVTNCSSDSRVVVRVGQAANRGFKALPDTLTIFPGNSQFFAVNFAPRQNGELGDTLKLIYHSISEPGQQQTANIVLRGVATGNRAFAMPNAFTPNGDGKNDAAKIHFSGYDPSALVLRVFDLRGLEVRLVRPERRGDPEIQWDGRDDRGSLQMPGAYLWLLENDGKKVGSGQVVLIR